MLLFQPALNDVLCARGVCLWWIVAVRRGHRGCSCAFLALIHTAVEYTNIPATRASRSTPVDLHLPAAVQATNAISSGEQNWRPTSCHAHENKIYRESKIRSIALYISLVLWWTNCSDVGLVLSPTPAHPRWDRAFSGEALNTRFAAAAPAALACNVVSQHSPLLPLSCRFPLPRSIFPLVSSVPSALREIHSSEATTPPWLATMAWRGIPPSTRPLTCSVRNDDSCNSPRPRRDSMR